MMLEQFSRTELVIGKDAVETLNKKHVAIFGIGGVGGNVCDALARSGIAHFDLIDNDIVSKSNINRQLVASFRTIGQYKVDVMKEKILDINPDAIVNVHKYFYLPDNNDFDFTQYDYVVDAIDTVAAKLDIIEKCTNLNIPVISSMGAGNKVNPCDIVVTDIYKTSTCPLARVMRRELKKRNIKKCKVVYSEEKSLTPLNEYMDEADKNSARRSIPGSTAFVPPVAGIIIASEVVKDLIHFDRENRK